MADSRLTVSRSGFPIVPSDAVPAWAGGSVNTSNPGVYASGIYVGVTGDVTLKDQQGNSLLFKAVPAGVIIPIVAQTVLASGTTATNLIGLE